MSNLVNVGDMIKINSGLGISEYPITRVTKTLAMSKRDDGYEHKFKREIGVSMAHPYQQWNTATYEVVRGHDG
jgi:hypothetical protein